jgi:hypothetical protein
MPYVERSPKQQRFIDMRYASKLVAMLFIGVAACAVDARPNATEDTDLSTRSTELSLAGLESATSTTQNVTCDSVWECDPICGTWVNGVLVRYPTNVLHQYCSDGSDTVVLTHPCGEVCF